MRRKLANTAFTDPDNLIASVRRALREIQYRPALTAEYSSNRTHIPRPDNGRHRTFKLSWPGPGIQVPARPLG